MVLTSLSGPFRLVPNKTYTVKCVCCVCCHAIDSGRQTCGRASRGHTGFLYFPFAVLALIFIARRIQSSVSSSTVKSNFVYPRVHLLGMIFFFVCV